MLGLRLRSKFRFSIAAVLTVSMVLVVGMLMSTLTVLDIRREASFSRDNLENQGLLLANTLNDVLADPLYYTDIDKVRDIADIVRSQPGVISVQVFKPDGRLLVMDSREDDPEYPTGSIRSELAMSSLQGRGTVAQFEGNILKIATSITAGKELLGGVELGFHTEALSAEIQRIVWQHIWQALALIAIGVILSWLLAQYFVRPLRKLVVATRALAEGDFEFSYHNRRNDEIGDLAAAFEDMSHRLGMSTAELRDANKQLLTEVSERKQAEERLQEARDTAIEASRAKSDFVASMSHEIRTPMNSIIAMAELLSKTPLNPQQQKYVQSCNTAGETLLALINDILDLSKVEAGQLTLEQIDFDLGELVESTLEFLAIRAHEKKLELNCHIGLDVPTALVGDPVHLRQVIINLVGNAIKFTEQGEVVLNVENNTGGGEVGSLLFGVSDTGIGISPEKMDSIFDDFSQADSSTTRKYGGTGLGLAISRRLVEMMEGRIWAESQVGGGSTFYFTAQFETRSEPNKRVDLIREDMKELRALIVDDNATNRLILKEMLAVWGTTAQEVEDGYHALAEIDRARKEDQPYHLVLLDHRMPDMDGFKVAEHIQEDLGIADMLIIMLTSDNQSENIARCQEIGISRYLIKPVKQSELLQAITVVLGLAAAEEPPPLAKPDAPEDQRSLRILVVDDFEVNCFIVQSHLEDTPYQIETAENGQIAVGKFISGDYDLVLMDMQMPVMDGYTATQMIRQWEREQGVKPTPIIALTADALKEATQKSLDAGCTTHVTKPIKRAPLMQAIYVVTRSAMA